MNIDNMKQICVALMEKSKAVYLTTLEDGYPYTRAMLNLRNTKRYPDQVYLFAEHNNDLMIYFSTNTASGKVRQIKANPRVSAYYCDPSHFHGLMLGGDIEIVDSSELRHALWSKGWEMYYPGGPDDPDHTVLRLFPKIAMGWYRAARFEFKP
ncbi:MAG: pyridoxamine 5'-phosphate oxidase family protein [Anaerolineae bacterium]|nr:pyridoxamine 5'-phosphate oxidase family protein [Anaerolineae bacterium]